MEQNQSTPSSSLFQLNIDVNSSYLLRSAASWSKVMAVIGFIMGSLFFIGAFLMQRAVHDTSGRFEGLFSDRNYDEGAVQTAVMIYMVILIIIGVIFVLSAIFAIIFGNKISAAMRTNDSNTLRAGFVALRNLFAFRTILMMIWLLIMLVMIIGIANSPASTKY